MASRALVRLAPVKSAPLKSHSTNTAYDKSLPTKLPFVKSKLWHFLSLGIVFGETGEEGLWGETTGLTLTATTAGATFLTVCLRHLLVFAFQAQSALEAQEAASNPGQPTLAFGAAATFLTERLRHLLVFAFQAQSALEAQEAASNLGQPTRTFGATVATAAAAAATFLTERLRHLLVLSFQAQSALEAQEAASNPGHPTLAFVAATERLRHLRFLLSHRHPLSTLQSSLDFNDGQFERGPRPPLNLLETILFVYIIDNQINYNSKIQITNFIF